MVNGVHDSHRIPLSGNAKLWQLFLEFSALSQTDWGSIINNLYLPFQFRSNVKGN